MKNNKILLSLARLEKEIINESGSLDSSIFDLTNNDFVEITSPLNYKLSAQLHNSGVVVKFSANTNYKATCAKCLEEFESQLECDATIFVDDIDVDMIDLTDEIREELLLNIPMNCLCSPDCKGLCHVCGVNLNHESCKCNDDLDAGPSVWDGLNDLKL